MTVPRMFAFVVLCAAFVPTVQASPPSDSVATTPAALRAALLHSHVGAAEPSFVALGGTAPERRRSVPLALGLSAVLPGAGQAYNGQWIKAAVAIATEAAIIVGYRSLVARGLEGEEAFQAYAHAYWSPVKYARWLQDYSDYLGDVGAQHIDIPEGIDFTNPAGWTSAERRLVRAFFNEIHAVEAQVYHPTTGASFSHKLPFHGDQQYYELIGKYFQFAPGWEDYPAWREDGEYTIAIDPDEAGPDGEKVNVRGRFWAYAADHAAANDLLRRASHVSGLLVLNHIIAAVDAAVFAKLHNDRIDADVRFAYGPQGGPVPVAAVRVRL